MIIKPSYPSDKPCMKYIVNGGCLLTVITPCRNSQATIQSTLESVLAVQQELYKLGFSMEYIVIDGLSSDRTLELVNGYQGLIHDLKVFVQPPRGIYSAMNHGLECDPAGHFTHILNSDDLVLDPAAYARVLADCKKKCISVILSSIVYFDRKSSQPKYIWKCNLVKNFNDFKANLKRGHHFPHPGFIALTDIYAKKKFDAKYHYSADYKLMQSILLDLVDPKSVAIFDVVLVAMGMGGATSSIISMLKGMREIHKINRELRIKGFACNRYISKFIQRCAIYSKHRDLISLKYPLIMALRAPSCRVNR